MNPYYQAYVEATEHLGHFMETVFEAAVEADTAAHVADMINRRNWPDDDYTHEVARATCKRLRRVAMASEIDALQARVRETKWAAVDWCCGQIERKIKAGYFKGIFGIPPIDHKALAEMREACSYTYVADRFLEDYNRIDEWRVA